MIRTNMIYCNRQYRLHLKDIGGYAMANFRETTVKTVIDVDGVETSTKIEKSTSITKNTEPPYIKVYTNMWAEFNGIPVSLRPLFMELATNMSYCNSKNLDKAQIVPIGGPIGQSIREALGIKERMFRHGLQQLVKLGAIKNVSRGYYQINPSYAGKGEWKYNPRLDQGGIEDLVAIFNFKDKTIETNIIWADDGEPTDFNEMYREGMGVKASDETVLTYTIATPTPTEENRLAQKEQAESAIPLYLEKYLENNINVPSYPQTKEECRSHEDCIAFVKFVQKKDKPGSAFYMAQELGLPTVSAKEAQEIWERLGEVA